MLLKRPLRNADLKLYEDLSYQLDKAIPKQFPLLPLPYDCIDAKCAIQSDNLFVGIALSNDRFIFDPRLYAMGVYSFSDYLAFVGPVACQTETPLFTQPESTLEPEILPLPFSSSSGFTDIKRLLILGPNVRSQKICHYLSQLGIQCIFHNEKLNNEIVSQLGTFDLVVSNGYPFRLEDEVIDKIGCRIINVHVTYLPWGKGIGTIFYAAILKQPTGISIHRINNRAIDSGPILLRKSVLIDHNLTTREVHAMLTQCSEKVFIDSFLDLCSNGFKEHPNQTDQMNYSAPYFSRYNFESLIRFFPLGYDTQIKNLIEFGEICKNNSYSFRMN